MKTFHYTLVLMLFVFAIPLSSQTTYWVPVKGIPKTSDVLSLFVTPDGTIFTGLYDHDVYRSTNNGMNWQNVHWGPAFSFASNHFGTVFFGSTQSSNMITLIYFSTDNGTTWDGGSIWEGSVYSVLPLSLTDVLCCTEYNLYKTTNPINRWSNLNFPIDTVRFRVLAQDSLGFVLLGTKNAGIFISIDSGLNWNQAFSTINGCTGITDLTVLGLKYYFASTENNGIFRGTYFGNELEQCNTGLPTLKTYSLTYTLDSTLYVGTDKGVYQSTDFGTTWQSFSTSLPPSTFIRKIASSPSGALYAGTVNKGLYKTQQLPKYFKGWNLVSLPFTVPDQNITALFPTASSHAFMYDTSYIEKIELTKGHGYWIKFDSTTPALYTGSPISEDTINIKKGWNLIGSISTPVSVDSLVHTPSETGRDLPRYGYGIKRTARDGEAVLWDHHPAG